MREMRKFKHNLFVNKYILTAYFKDKRQVLGTYAKLVVTVYCVKFMIC